MPVSFVSFETGILFSFTFLFCFIYRHTVFFFHLLFSLEAGILFSMTTNRMFLKTFTIRLTQIFAKKKHGLNLPASPPEQAPLSA